MQRLANMMAKIIEGSIREWDQLDLVEVYEKALHNTLSHLTATLPNTLL